MWIPRELNAKADAISKLTYYDDYTITEAIFQRIDLFWGPHTVDRFACSYNAKVPRFNTRFFQTGCAAVDAFSQDWGHDNNWICPPVCLLIRVVKHMELCKARGTVILPLWKSSCFWTLFCRDGVHWNSFVIDWVFIPKFPGLIRGKARNSNFGSRRPVRSSVKTVIVVITPAGVCIHRGSFFFWVQMQFVSVNPSVITLSPLYLVYGLFGTYSCLK